MDGLADWLAAPGDPEVWKRGWDALKQQTAAGPHDMRLERIDDEGAEISMTITDAARQPFGLFHGGVSLLLAESAASLHSCWGVDLGKVAPVGIEINGTHLNGAREGTVRAVATVIKRGRTLVVHDVEVRHDESGKVLCKARVTNLLRPHSGQS